MIIKSISILRNLLGGLLISSLLVSFSSLSMADMPPKYDLVLTNGTIVDGTGSARFDGDVGIKDGRIAAVGDLSSEAASKTVDITGQVVAPGFIDVHSHADRAFGSPKTRKSRGGQEFRQEPGPRQADGSRYCAWTKCYR